MPLTGPSTTSPGRGRPQPSWLRQNSTTTKPSWATKGTSESPEVSSNSGSDAKSDTPSPRRVSKVTITPKNVNGQKKEAEKTETKTTTPRKPSIPNAMFRLAEKQKPSPTSTDNSRSSSLASSSDKSRSTTPATKKVTPVPVKKAKSPSPESEESDSSSYEEVTVTESEESEEEIELPVNFVSLRKVSKPEIVTKKEKSATPEPEFLRPALKKVEKKPEVDTQARRPSSPEITTSKFVKPALRKVRRDPSKKEFPKEKLLETVELKKTPKQERELRREPTIPSIQEIKQENVKKIPPPPPPPPPKGLQPPDTFQKKTISESAKQRIDKLKKRPRRRPDWSDMMKEVEEGKKLRHVECNDRSQPIIQCKSMTKVENKFIFETENKDTKLHALLKEIQGGVKLKAVQTNDRSKPVLEGLRKFKRQMTLEEQLQKSESKAQLDLLPPSVVENEMDSDEMEDVDKLRDDLQSTKQMLAHELRNKEAQERENKRLLEKIKSLEAELTGAKTNGDTGGGGGQATTKAFTDDDPLVKALKKEATEAQKVSKEIEKKYQDAALKLDIAKAELEEQKKIVQRFIAQGLDGDFSDIYNKEGGQLPQNVQPRRLSEHQERESSPEPSFTDSEDDGGDEDDEEKKKQKAMRSLMREVKLLRFRLDKYKEKEDAAKLERKNLKEQMKNNQKGLKEEKKKHKKLQKEVEKMAAMMNDVDEEDEDGDEEKPAKPSEEEQQEEESESEDESESESEESDVQYSDSENEDAPDSRKKKNLEPRVKRHENRLAALKKGNLLLLANVERLKDEINKQKEASNILQADLDSVINDLGI